MEWEKEYFFVSKKNLIAVWNIYKLTWAHKDLSMVDKSIVHGQFRNRCWTILNCCWTIAKTIVNGSSVFEEYFGNLYWQMKNWRYSLWGVLFSGICYLCLRGFAIPESMDCGFLIHAGRRPAVILLWIWRSTGTEKNWGHSGEKCPLPFGIKPRKFDNRNSTLLRHCDSLYTHI